MASMPRSSGKVRVEAASWEACRIISVAHDDERHGSAPYSYEGSRKRPDGWRHQVVLLCWRDVHFVARYDSVYAMKRCDGTCDEGEVDNFRSFFRPVRDSISNEFQLARERFQLPSSQSGPVLRVVVTDEHVGQGWKRILVLLVGIVLIAIGVFVKRKMR